MLQVETCSVHNQTHILILLNKSGLSNTLEDQKFRFFGVGNLILKSASKYVVSFLVVALIVPSFLLSNLENGHKWTIIQQAETNILQTTYGPQFLGQSGDFSPHRNRCIDSDFGRLNHLHRIVFQDSINVLITRHVFQP